MPACVWCWCWSLLACADRDHRDGASLRRGALAERRAGRLPDRRHLAGADDPDLPFGEGVAGRPSLGRRRGAANRFGVCGGLTGCRDSNLSCSPVILSDSYVYLACVDLRGWMADGGYNTACHGDLTRTDHDPSRRPGAAHALASARPVRRDPAQRRPQLDGSRGPVADAVGPRARGWQVDRIMLEAHNSGRAVVIVCPLEPAELYRERLESCSLTATIEAW